MSGPTGSSRWRDERAQIKTTLCELVDEAAAGLVLTTGGTAIPYCIELIGGAWIDTKPERLAAFRPKSARRSPA